MFMEQNAERRRQSFIAKDAASYPALYSTEGVPVGEKDIYAHYFCAEIDYWLAEYDAETNMGFGFVCLGDGDNAEWGYFMLDELEGVVINVIVNLGSGEIPMGLVIEREEHWQVRTAKDAIPARFHKDWWFKQPE